MSIYQTYRTNIKKKIAIAVIGSCLSVFAGNYIYTTSMTELDNKFPHIAKIHQIEKDSLEARIYSRAQLDSLRAKTTPKELHDYNSGDHTADFLGRLVEIHGVLASVLYYAVSRKRYS